MTSYRWRNTHLVGDMEKWNMCVTGRVSGDLVGVSCLIGEDVAKRSDSHGDAALCRTLPADAARLTGRAIRCDELGPGVCAVGCSARGRGGDGIRLWDRDNPAAADGRHAGPSIPARATVRLQRL